jgi:hypothetical protein
MKKILLFFLVAAVALAFASPAMAFKVTTKGHMEVNGMIIKNDVIDDDNADNSNSWYSMEMIIKPTFHINDKVRIHNQVRIMERDFSGTGPGDNYDNNNLNKYRIAGAFTNNFWWERCYLSFPLFGGTLYIGRMSGGNWGHKFADDDQNRDRIKYVRKVGHAVVLGVIEKRSEGDGHTVNPAIGSVDFLNSASDEDGYAVGAIIPFSKNFIFKPLLYWIHGQGDTIAGLNRKRDIRIWFADFTVKVGNLKIDAEFAYAEGDDDTLNWDYEQMYAYLDAFMNFGPAQIGIGGFYIGGTDLNQTGTFEFGSIVGTGSVYEPFLLWFSEDMGFMWDATGVAHGGAGTSGFECFYIRGAYKISDTMKLSAILGILQAEEMANGIDDDLGMEFDISFEWKLMPNLKYMIDFGYWNPGDYFEDVFVGLDDNNVMGLRHTIRIEW